MGMGRVARAMDHAVARALEQQDDAGDAARVPAPAPSPRNPTSGPVPADLGQAADARCCGCGHSDGVADALGGRCDTPRPASDDPTASVPSAGTLASHYDGAERRCQMRVALAAS